MQEFIVFKSGRYSNPGHAGDLNKWGDDWGGPIGQQNNDGWMLEGGTRQMWDGNKPNLVTVNGTDATLSGNRWQFTNDVNQYMLLKVNPVNTGSAFGRIGRPNNNWGNGQLDVAEVIVYNRVLSSDEENAVGYYLATKYGVTTSYVAPPAPKQITSFTFPSYGVATIAGTNITMSVPGGTDLHLSPTYTYLGQSCTPASGSQHDFSVPVHYIVTATDSTTTDYTVTVSIAPWINVNIDNTARAGLVGPGGGLGDTWNTFTSVSASALLNNAGAATGVGYTSGGTSWGGPDSWGGPALVMLTQGLRNLDVGSTNSQYLIVNNLPHRRYNVFIASENNSDAGASSGVWSTTNTTTTVGGQSVSNTGSVNGTTWVQGVNYVLFENVVPDSSGNITLNGHSVPTTQHSDARLPLNGFQLVDVGAAPGYASWASQNGMSNNPHDDSNNDGVQNGIAYFMKDAGRITLPVVGADNKVTWTNGGNILKDQYGTQFVVQTSTDLDHWTDVGSGDGNLSNTDGSVSYTLPTSQGTLFCRLVVTPN